MSIEGLFYKTEKAILTRWPFLILSREFPKLFLLHLENFKNECISNAVYGKLTEYFLYKEIITYQL